MKRTISLALITSLACSFSNLVLAQKEKKVDPKHTNYYSDIEEAIEVREFAVQFSNGVSRIDMFKCKAKFTNSTNDFLLVEPSKFSITVDGVTVHPKEKSFILDPNESKAKTIDITEGANFHTDAVEISIAGFSRISMDGTPTKVEPFQLPASVNVVEAGNFTVNLKFLSQETQQTTARFEVKYKGDGYAIVDPSRVSIKTEGGDQFANLYRKSKSFLLEKGDSKSFDVVVEIPAKIVDMQFAKLFVNFGDSMIETSAKPLDAEESVTFELDATLTAEKNK
jgi:hypothetical protein